MIQLRVFLRILGVAFWTFSLAPFLLPGLLLSLVWHYGGYRLRGWVITLWARLVRWTIGMRVTVKGTPPKDPYILVANHLGYVDIFLMCGNLHGWYIAKSDVRSWPIMGFILRCSNVLFIDRTRRSDVVRMGKVMEKCLDRGMSLVFYPEGTSTSGADVARFKPSLLQLPAQRNFPVHAAVLTYKTPDGAPPAGDAVCWWGDADFGPHFLDLMKVKSFSAELQFIEQTQQATDRKELASALHAEISAAFVPTVQGKLKQDPPS